MCTLVFAAVLPVHANAEGAWQGNGTAGNPYQLSTFEDIDNLRVSVNEDHESYEGVYFKVTSDIAFPATWSGIGTATVALQTASDLCAFSGTLDGDGHTFEFATGSKPLFAFVDNTTVMNLKVHGTFTSGTALVENHVRWTLPSGVQRRSLTADHITLKTGTVTYASGLLGGFAGAGNSVLISNCVAEQGVLIGWDAAANAPSGLSRVGSFAGDVNGRIVGCSSAASVYGVDYVGGIVGAKGQAMGAYEISGCAFTGTVNATGSFVGGIAGGGYGRAEKRPDQGERGVLLLC